ncbi:hypothetical protein D3C80_1390300 [compost metagenome]
MFSQFGKQLIRRLQILFVAAIGNRRCQQRTVGLRRNTYFAYGHLIVAFEQIAPGLGRILDQLIVADEGNGPAISHDPMTVFVFGPRRNVVPVGRLVGLGYTLPDGNRAERLANVADVA